MNNPRRVYWDTCAWIGLLNEEPQRKTELRTVYQNAKSGRFDLVTSTISLVEFRRLSSEHRTDPRPLSENNEQKIDSLFRQPFIVLVSVTVPVGVLARKLSRQYMELDNFKDSIHVATAILNNVEVIHTYDDDHLLPLNEHLRCKNHNSLSIVKPDPSFFTHP